MEGNNETSKTGVGSYSEEAGEQAQLKMAGGGGIVETSYRYAKPRNISKKSLQVKKIILLLLKSKNNQDREKALRCWREQSTEDTQRTK